jgi:hypothetical protein
MNAVLIGLVLSFFVPSLVPVVSLRAAPSRGCRADTSTSRIVQVRMYSQSRLPEAGLVAMFDTTNRIWLSYGVRIEPGGGADAVVVVVSDAPIRNTPRRTVLGTTLFVKGHATPNISLSLGSAEQLAASMDMTPAFESRPPADRDEILLRMLGVALAHEIGHYLMDTERHSSSGLLQSAISTRDLQGGQLSHLGLTDDQQRLLCDGRPSARRDH